jgi:hypothetical protein
MALGLRKLEGGNGESPKEIMRSWLRIILLVTLGMLTAGGETFPEEMKKQIGERFGGEDVRYEAGFWVFPALGGGTARFYDLGDNRFLVTHEGQAKGVAGWLSRNRKEIFRAWMGAAEQGSRLVPLRLEEESVIGDWVRRKTTVYDYSARKVLMETTKDGEVSRETVEIPPGVYYDNPMTAYYNFRYEVYGKAAPGREFVIRTVPRKGPGFFRVAVAPEKEAARIREEDPEKKGKDLLVRIFLEQEFLGSPKGEIEVWFDRELNPVSGMVRKVKFIGDVKGRITQFSYRAAHPPRLP